MKMNQKFRAIAVAALCVIGMMAGAQDIYDTMFVNRNMVIDHRDTCINNIRIYNGATLTIRNNSIVSLFTDGVIVVENGCTLIVDRSTLQSCKDKPWKGIEASPNSVVEITRGSLIRNAYTAVKIENDNNGSVSGYIIIDESTIVNCGIGVYLYGYSSSGSYFRRSYFMVNDNIALSFHNFINSRNSTIPYIYGCEFSNWCLGLNSQNHLCSNAKGIDAFNCDIYINKSGGTRSSFKNMNIAIQSGSGQPKNIYINNTDFVNNINGLMGGVEGDVTVKNSTFQMDASCIGYNNIYKYGICLAQAQTFLFEYNQFFTTQHNYYSTGISVGSSTTGNNYIRFNDFENLTVGVMNGGVNGAIIPSVGFVQIGQPTLYSGVQLLCNSFEYNNFAIYNNSMGIMGNPQGTYVSAQIKNDAGNSFTGNAGYDINNDNLSFTLNYYYTGTMPNVNNTSAELASILSLCSQLTDDGSDCSPEAYAMLKSQASDTDDNIDIINRMLIMENKALRGIYSRMTDGDITRLDSLRMWYELIDRPDAKYALVNVLYAMGQYGQSLLRLQAIREDFGLDEREQKEHESYVDLYTVRENMRNADRDWTEMTDYDKEILMNVAENGEGKPKTMVRNILCVLGIECYANEEETEAEGVKQYAHSTENGKAPLSLVPNPAATTIRIEGRFDGPVNVTIYTVDGIKSKVFKGVKAGEDLDVSQLNEGLYIYQVAGKECNHEGKLIIKTN